MDIIAICDQGADTKNAKSISNEGVSNGQIYPVIDKYEKLANIVTLEKDTKAG